MNDCEPSRSAQDEYRAVRNAVAVLAHALPAFRELVAEFRAPLHQFLALDAATASTRLAELARTLSVQAVRLSDRKQAIASNVANAMHAIGRCRQHLHAAHGDRGAAGQLQGLMDSTARGIAEVEHMVAEAEQLLESEVQRIVELALKFDLPDTVLQRAQHLLDRARR